jgi:peptide/nickel transport system substrate-binding protein
MRDWKPRDTVMTLFMIAVVVVMFLQMIQNDRLYDRVNDSIDLIEQGVAVRPQQAAQADLLREDEWLVPDGVLGGTVVMGYSARPKNLNPITYKDAYGDIILDSGGVYESLIERDRDTLEFVGQLAEGWSISEDGQTITFKLKENACWNDLKLVTAEDVVFSFRTLMLPTVDAQRIQSYFLDCEKVEAVDSRTVKFVWSKPYFKSLETSGSMVIIPKHVIDPDNLIDSDPKAFAKMINEWDWDWKDEPPVTSGPYILHEWDKPGNRVVLIRNDDYYGPKSMIRRVVYRFISDTLSRFQALKAEKLDLIALTTEQWENQTQNEEFLKKFQKVQWLRADAGYNYIGWNNEVWPFDQKKVRQAMSYCMPREQIIKSLFYDLRVPANGPFGPGSKQSSPNVGQWPFDPDKAAELLAEAGFADSDGDGLLDKDGQPLRFSLMMPSGSDIYEQIVSIFQDELSKIGVEMDIAPYEWSVFVKNLDERSFDACMLAWTGTVEGDPNQIWHSDSIGNNGSNHIGYRNPEVDRLIREARQEMDEQKRNEMFHKIHELIFEDQPYTFLFSGPTLLAHHKRLQNVIPHALGTNLHEWWIPEDQQWRK